MLGKNNNLNEKTEKTYDEVMKVIDGWCDDLEVRLIGDDLQAVKNEVWKAVQKGRLTFDSNEEIFTYVLKKPIEKADGSGNISMIKIHETTMKQKENFMKKKNDDLDSQVEFYNAFCKDSEMKEISPGFIMRIKDRDNSIIVAVVTGFFLQAVPGSKSAN